MSIFCDPAESDDDGGSLFKKSLKELNELGFVVLPRPVYDKLLSRLAETDATATDKHAALAMKDVKW